MQGDILRPDQDGILALVWLGDAHSLNTIRTVSLLPMDLNSLMVHLEQTASVLRADSIYVVLQLPHLVA